MDDYPYLLPKPDHLTEGWWDALRRHELVIQECGDCHAVRHPPLAVCPECGSETIDWLRTDGKGTVYSYIVVHQTALPAWRDSVPYNIAMIALDSAPQVRVYGNVVDIENSEIEIGMPLQAVFDDVTAEDTILRWQPDRADEKGQ